MAERGVLARRTDRGTYDVLQARWGATDPAVATVCSGQAPTSLPVAWESARTEPGFGAVLGSLDVLGTAALYRAHRDSSTAFLPLWFGLGFASTPPLDTGGGLVAVYSLRDAQLLRDRFRRFKGHLVDGVAAGFLPVSALPALFEAAIGRLDGRERYLTVPEHGARRLG
jgi:hypothetical protein